jgi:hypothetical protein
MSEDRLNRPLAQPLANLQFALHQISFLTAIFVQYFCGWSPARTDEGFLSYYQKAAVAAQRRN